MQRRPQAVYWAFSDQACGGCPGPLIAPTLTFETSARGSFSTLATNVGVAVLIVTPDKTTASPTKSRYSPSSTAKTSRRPACTAAESLKIRLPAMVDSPRAIKSRASRAGSGPAVVSSADSSAAGSRSVARGSNSVRDSVLDCPSITPLLMTRVSPSGSRALGGESFSDGVASGATSVMFSGYDILAGPNHCGGSVGCHHYRLFGVGIRNRWLDCRRRRSRERQWRRRQSLRPSQTDLLAFVS